MIPFLLQKESRKEVGQDRIILKKAITKGFSSDLMCIMKTPGDSLAPKLRRTKQELESVRQRIEQATSASERRRWEVVRLMLVLEHFGDRELLKPYKYTDAGPRSWANVVAQAVDYDAKYVRRIMRTYALTKDVTIINERLEGPSGAPTGRPNMFRTNNDRWGEDQLREELTSDKSPNERYWDSQEVMSVLESDYGITVSRSTAYRLLNRHKPSWKETKRRYRRQRMRRERLVAIRRDERRYYQPRLFEDSDES